MRKLQAIAFTICLGLLCNFCAAQNEDPIDDLLGPKHSYFKASLSYLSDNVYFGRKDSLKVPYITPTFGYYNKSGIFFTASTSYMPTESRLDLYTIGGGYLFAKGKWDGELTANKYFYNGQSYSVKSQVTADAGGQFGYDAGPIELNLSAIASFTSSTDFAVGFGLDHEFSLINDQMKITPTFIMNGGTQYYYDAYYRKVRYIKKRKGKLPPRTITAYTLNPGAFRILDYEPSLPIDYYVNKFTFSFNPTVAIPVNPNTIVRTVKPVGGVATTKTFKEKINTTFFWSLEMVYKF